MLYLDEMWYRTHKAMIDSFTHVLQFLVVLWVIIVMSATLKTLR